MILILDEWLIHDLQGENGFERQSESFQFLERVKERCDKVVFVRGSKFLEKVWGFSEVSARDSELRKKFKFLKTTFIFNNLKSEILDLEDIESESDEEILKDVNYDDHYIVLSYLYFRRRGEDVKIITTDRKLKSVLERGGVLIDYRDDFVRGYLS
jgi:hypothetical protein